VEIGETSRDPALCRASVGVAGAGFESLRPSGNEPDGLRLRTSPALVRLLVWQPSLPLLGERHQFAAEGRDVRDDPAPDQVKGGHGSFKSVSDGPPGWRCAAFTPWAGVDAGVAREAREKMETGQRSIREGGYLCTPPMVRGRLTTP
jgi:hypothetical protein